MPDFEVGHAADIVTVNKMALVVKCLEGRRASQQQKGVAERNEETLEIVSSECGNCHLAVRVADIRCQLGPYTFEISASWAFD